MSTCHTCHKPCTHPLCAECYTKLPPLPPITPPPPAPQQQSASRQRAERVIELLRAEDQPQQQAQAGEAHQGVYPKVAGVFCPRCGSTTDKHGLNCTLGFQEEIATLRSKLEQSERELTAELLNTVKRARTAEADRDRLRKALEFYAGLTASNTCLIGENTNASCEVSHPLIVGCDLGKTAREALARGEGGVFVCLNCGNDWDRKGQCPGCLMTHDEVLAAIERAVTTPPEGSAADGKA